VRRPGNFTAQSHVYGLYTNLNSRSYIAAHSQQVGIKSPSVKWQVHLNWNLNVALQAHKLAALSGTFCCRLKRSHSATDPSMLEESSRPPAGVGTHTSDVTLRLGSALPCIVCGHRNPNESSGQSEFPRPLAGNHGADESEWKRTNVRAGGATRLSRRRRSRARGSRPVARRRPGKRRGRWLGPRRGRDSTRSRRRRSGGRGSSPWASVAARSGSGWCSGDRDAAAGGRGWCWR
jgi:hypothetical protein